jgi:hypothetical protein
MFDIMNVKQKWEFGIMPKMMHMMKNVGVS